MACKGSRCSGCDDCDSDCRDDRCGRNTSRSEDGKIVAQFSSSATIDRNVDQVQVLAEDVAITLPSNPANGKTVSVVSTESGTTVKTKCHDFCGTESKTLNIAPCTEARFTFVECREIWIFSGATVPAL